MTEPRYTHALLLPAHIAPESDESVVRLVDEGAKPVELPGADDGPEYDDRDYLPDAEASARLCRLVNHVQSHSFIYGSLYGVTLGAWAVAVHFIDGGPIWMLSACFILLAVAFLLLHRRKVRYWLSGLEEAGLDEAGL